MVWLLIILSDGHNTRKMAQPLENRGQIIVPPFQLSKVASPGYMARTTGAVSLKVYWAGICK